MSLTSGCRPLHFLSKRTLSLPNFPTSCSLPSVARVVTSVQASVELPRHLACEIQAWLELVTSWVWCQITWWGCIPESILMRSRQRAISPISHTAEKGSSVDRRHHYTSHEAAAWVPMYQKSPRRCFSEGAPDPSRDQDRTYCHTLYCYVVAALLIFLLLIKKWTSTERLRSSTLNGLLCQWVFGCGFDSDRSR